MKPPTAYEFTGITVIAAVLCVVALAIAFAGAGSNAIAVLAVIVGPASILFYRAYAGAPKRDATRSDGLG